MKNNKENNWQDIKLNSLQGKLRSLGHVEIPQTLEAKLLASIPFIETELPRRRFWHPRLLVFGMAAAAVVVAALIITASYFPRILSKPSGASGRMLAGLNDISERYLLADHNTTLIESNGPGELLWQVVNQNEPGADF